MMQRPYGDTPAAARDDLISRAWMSHWRENRARSDHIDPGLSCGRHREAQVTFRPPDEAA
jgi:hypothetical protein